MSADLRFRDAFRAFTPKWLQDRLVLGKTAGYRVLWVLISMLDVGAEVLFEGLSSWFPGLGTPTAIPLISRSRGIIRGQVETDESFASRLQQWLELWRTAGTALAVAREIRHYLGNTPRVRIVTRSSYWVTLNADGTIVRKQGSPGDGEWDWDSVSHPSRSTWWSEIWIIVYPTQWALRGDWGGGDDWGGDDLGFGHECNRVERDAIVSLIATWKAAHTKVRAVIWTSDAALFDPDDDLTLPDGEWGAWGTTGAGSRTASNRNVTTCRYWEPN
jgi:hypothetical protein